MIGVLLIIIYMLFVIPKQLQKKFNYQKWQMKNMKEYLMKIELLKNKNQKSRNYYNQKL